MSASKRAWVGEAASKNEPLSRCEPGKGVPAWARPRLRPRRGPSFAARPEPCGTRASVSAGSAARSVVRGDGRAEAWPSPSRAGSPRKPTCAGYLPGPARCSRQGTAAIAAIAAIASIASIASIATMCGSAVHLGRNHVFLSPRHGDRARTGERPGNHPRPGFALSRGTAGRPCRCGRGAPPRVRRAFQSLCARDGRVGRARDRYRSARHAGPRALGRAARFCC